VYYNVKRGDGMLEKLKIKAIYDDFVKNVALTDEQIKILDMVLNKEKIIKISMEIGTSERTVNYEIKKIKKLYNDYYNLQLYKAMLLL
jgi:DNA-binding NarL/FixJ family response regulator